MTIKEKVCSFDSLYNAMKKCKREVSWKDSVQKYCNNGLSNIYDLRQSLLNGTYQISKYTNFKIYEPKERDIVATRFKDRVFQKSLCDNYVYENLTRSFIYDNCACQRNKGTEFARRRLVTHFQKFYRHDGINGYILKMDIKNYFGSTLHSVAKAAVQKRLKDDWAANHVYNIIDSYGDKIGLGLGSELTQLIQLAVLDDIDHMIKEQLHIKHYIRYMDDMVILHQNKNYLKTCLDTVINELSKIGLELNEKKTQIFPIKQGVKFLGFKFYLTDSGKVVLNLLKKKQNRQRRKLNNLAKRYYNNLITQEQFQQSFDSFIAHIDNTPKHAKRHCYKIKQHITVQYNSLIKQKTYTILQ